MEINTLINGGFLVIGLLIGHFLTKSSQIKQLRAQFEFERKIKWIDEIKDLTANLIDSLYQSLDWLELIKDKSSKNYKVYTHKEIIEKSIQVAQSSVSFVNKLSLLLSNEEESQEFVLAYLQVLRMKITNAIKESKYEEMEEAIGEIYTTFKKFIGEEYKDLAKLI